MSQPTASEYIDMILQGEVEPDASGCILWPFALDAQGYARVRHDGDNRKAARVVLGEPPSDDVHACHASHDVCGSRHCVSPEHLRWATAAENMADQYEDETRVRGEAHPQSVLSDDLVILARRRAAAGEAVSTIADDLNVSAVTLREAVKGKTWGHLPGAVSLSRWTVPPTPRVKISAQQGDDIRRRYAQGGIRQQDLADEYGVSIGTINRVIHQQREMD